jgi:putative transposase
VLQKLNTDTTEIIQLIVTAVKSVKQSCDTPPLLPLMEIFRKIVNDCINVGLKNDIFSLKKLSKLTYQKLARYDIISYYKLCAISHAAGILANKKKSLKRGLKPRQPYAKRLLLIAYRGFKVVTGKLKVPLGQGHYYDILLNSYVKQIVLDPSVKIRSSLLTLSSLSICYSKEVSQIECNSVAGIDRNLANVTIGNCHHTKQFNLSKAADITENTRSIMRSFKRNDARIRKKLYSKYGMRRKNRVNQLLHKISKIIALESKQNKTAIAFEDIRHIRKLYQRGNYQSRSYRGSLNSWSFSEIKRQIEYKAAWEGVPVIQLSVKETRGTSQLCPRCGKKITQVDRRTRQLWCAEYKRWIDRDVIAAMNLSIRGRSFLAKSRDEFIRPEGLASEAMVQELGSKEPIILKVDASKLTFRRKLKS